MIPSYVYLDPQDRETFRTAVAFLNNRLAEQGTMDWALKLKPGQRIERIAIAHLLADPSALNFSEPWASAWRLIEESWSAPQSDERNGTAVYGIQQRLRAGDRSGVMVTAIVDLVAPRLKVEPISDWRWNYTKRPRAPKTIGHTLSASLTSGDLVDLTVLDVASLNDIDFLISLAHALEAAVSRGIDIARRLGWNEKRSFLLLGMLHRVYYTQPTGRGGEDGEPDAYHRGIAPSVKLLHAVVARLGEILPSAARTLIQRWRIDGSPVFIRLWAAMARSSELVAASDVASFLRSLENTQFWQLHSFPEIAELRAVRFNEFDRSLQKQILVRLKKGPPRNHWPKKLDKEKVASARQYWAARELKRIEVAGAALPRGAKDWLNARQQKFADLAQMVIDADFPEGVTTRHLSPNPDDRYDDLQGGARLQALETALAASRGGWDDDPAERASDWINKPSNAKELLADFESTNNGGDDFPKVWNRFGWAHRPHQKQDPAGQDDNQEGEVSRALGFLNQLSNATLLNAIEGVCAWLDAWEKQVVKLPFALPIWLRLWPIAVEVTNRTPDEVDNEELSALRNDQDQVASDALNTPVGKLVGLFLAACPSLQSGARVFPANAIETQMRDIVISAGGRSGLIAKHRMIEALPYFLHADHDWAQEHLIAPLLKDDQAALALWRAVARRTHFTEVLKIIGAVMAERANDRRLGRETRSRLVFSLVVDSLHAFHQGRDPAVPNQRIQQMLRTLDDEVRGSAANVIQKFVRELSTKAATGTLDDDATLDSQEQEDTTAAAALFRTAAAPFLREVWPQERSLATPGVSGALADLPAASGEAFAEAVDAIERFLVPFECWSMLDYGLFGDDGETKKLAIIDDDAKARALLKLLDLTIGKFEGAVIPHDLTDALDQILKVAPRLASSPAFRRLSTAARR